MSSSSRTCTGPTRPRSTCCASSAGGSRRRPRCSIASYRDEGLTADHRLRIALGDLAALRSTNRVRLAPLSAAGVRLLSAASGLDPAELFRLTGGNPFYVTEVLQAGMREVPAAARDVVLARAPGSARPPRELLDVTALLGTRIEPDADRGGRARLGGAPRRDPRLRPARRRRHQAEIPARDRPADGRAGDPGSPAWPHPPADTRPRCRRSAARTTPAGLPRRRRGRRARGAPVRDGRRAAGRRAGLAPGGRGAVPAGGALR